MRGYAFLLGLAAAEYARAIGRHAYLTAAGVRLTGCLNTVAWHRYKAKACETSSPVRTGSRASRSSGVRSS